MLLADCSTINYGKHLVDLPAVSYVFFAIDMDHRSLECSIRNQ